jgi:hypothetical protein
MELRLGHVKLLNILRELVRRSAQGGCEEQLMWEEMQAQQLMCEERQVQASTS